MAKDKITIEVLAGMVQRGFVEQAKQIQAVHDDITGVKNNVKGIEEDIKNIKTDIKNIETDIKNIETDVKDIKEDVKDVQNTSNRIETLQKSELNRTDEISVRVSKLEKVRV